MNNFGQFLAGTSTQVPSILSSTDSSDDSDNTDFPPILSDVYLKVASAFFPEEHPKQENYLDVVSKYSDRDFWRHFRCTRSTFELIISHLKMDCDQNVYVGGHLPMSVEEMLLITLQYLGNQGSMRLLADKFGRSDSSICKTIEKVCTFFFENQSKFVKWPETHELEKNAKNFKDRAGFPGTIGAIDGTHIAVHPPAAQQKAYLNYKRFHSIVLMAVVLPDKSFSSIFTGFPGSNHDAYVFQRSSLFDTLNSIQNPLFESKKYHIVGDSAFPLHSWLMTPYKKGSSSLSPSQRRYNYKHSATRIVVEQAFGDLLNRFKRCNDVDADMEKVVKIVTSCCVIHNVCIKNGDFSLENDTHVVPNVAVNPYPRNLLSNISVCALQKRESIRSAL